MLTVFVTGDNLGINSILGFNECFRSNYYCRFCKCAKEACSKNCCDTLITRRTIENYNEDLQINDNSKTGIKENSIMNRVSNFHVTQNFAVDSMHDLAEGVFHYFLLKMFDKFIKVHTYITNETLNSRISIFDFGPSVSLNKPSILGEFFLQKTKFKYSAAEMKCFFLNLPAMIGDLIPVDNIEWDIYLKLREIYVIVISEVCHIETHKLLDVLISEFLEMYIGCFKEDLKPKFHLLVHYGMIMGQIGPLTSPCSIRYEAKHQEFKRTMINTSCRKNILQTISIKHQLKFVHTLFSYHEISKTSFEYGPSRLITDLPYQIKFNFKIYSTLNLKTINWFKFNGNLYKKRVVIQYDQYDDELPVFGLIDSCFICEDILYLAIEDLETLEYNRHYCGHFVKKTNKYLTVDFKKLNVKEVSYLNVLADKTLFVNWLE